jgi:hypothetical protein
MCVQHALHRVAQIERAAHRLGAMVKRRNPEREERRVNPALLEPWQIGMAVSRALPEVFIVDEDSLDCVDVGVEFDVVLGV